VLIGEALWRRRFGGDPAIVGRTIQMNGASYQVAGVMAADFRFPTSDSQVWYPLAMNVADPFAGSFRIAAVGQMRPGVTTSAVHDELARLLTRLPEAYPNVFPGISTADILRQSHIEVGVKTLRDDIAGDFGRVLWIVGAAAARQHDAVGFDVAMDHAVLVSVGERSRHLTQHADDFRDRESAFRESSSEARPFDERHRVERKAVGFASRQHGNDVRMLQARGDLDLALEAVDTHARCQVGWKYLHDDLAAGCRLVGDEDT
jgi:MacB-like protein